MELARLSYLTFGDASQKTIAKDYLIRGVHPEMPETHSESDIDFMGSYRGNYNRGNRGRRGQFWGMPTRTLDNQPRRYCSCQNPEHLIRNCPT